MKKKVIAILFVVVAVLFALGVGSVQVAMPKIMYELSFTEDIVAQEGVAPDEMVYSMEVSEKGIYVIYLNWISNPSGMLMACNITDENGANVNTFGGHCVDMMSREMPLEAGEYTLTLTPLTSLEQWKLYWADFDKTGWDAYTDDPETKFTEDGNFHFEFACRLERSRDVQGIVCVLFVLIGVILFVILLAAAQKDNSMKQNYDERQELLRGRGAKYGLYTMFFLNMILFLVEMVGVSLPMSAGLALLISIWAGGGVFAVYCIWNEAYFALNQKANVFIGFFSIVAAMNMIIGLQAFFDGTAIQKNQFTLRSMNLFCGIMMIVLCGALILKKVFRDREEE